MGLKCLFGHKWNGCKCEKCGEARDERHIWLILDGKCIEKCTICGKERVTHKWDGCKCDQCGKIRNVEHKWKYCKCNRCGATRDVEHRWNVVNGKDIEKCSICEKERCIANKWSNHHKLEKCANQTDKDTFEKHTGSGVCEVCEYSLDGLKAYVVPNNLFYNSQEWRNYFIKNNPVVKLMGAFGMNPTDEYFEQMQRNDNSTNSAVCENCIHMFKK